MNVRRRSMPNSVVKEIHTMVNHYSIRDFVVQLLLATLFILTLGWSLAANAQETTYDASFDAATKEGIPINVLVGQSRVINFDRPIGRFSISNPEIAEAVMVSPNQVLVNGKGFGQVNFIFTGSGMPTGAQVTHGFENVGALSAAAAAAAFETSEENAE